MDIDAAFAMPGFTRWVLDYNCSTDTHAHSMKLDLRQPQFRKLRPCLTDLFGLAGTSSMQNLKLEVFDALVEGLLQF